MNCYIGNLHPESLLKALLHLSIHAHNRTSHPQVGLLIFETGLEKTIYIIIVADWIETALHMEPRFWSINRQADRETYVMLCNLDQPLTPLLHQSVDFVISARSK